MISKYILTLGLILGSCSGGAPAFASQEASKSPTKPVCGTTVPECQKAWEAGQEALAKSQKALDGAIQQRNQAQISLLNNQLNSYTDSPVK